MPQPSKKKVVKKTLVSLYADSLAALKERTEKTGKDQSQVIRDCLIRGVRFSDFVEDHIAQYQKEHKVSRQHAMEALLIEAVRLKGKKL